MHKTVNGIDVPLTNQEISEYTQREITHEIFLEEEAKTKYQRDRQFEYPSVADQLGMMYEDKVNGTDIWQSTITAIKVKYPKPQ